MAAPICSTSRAEPSRSTRAISEACSVVGMASCCAGWSSSFAFEHRLGQFLDEQRHAVGALDDLLEQRLRQRLAAGDVLDQRHALAPAEAVERHGGDVRLAGPGRLEVRADA